MTSAPRTRAWSRAISSTPPAASRAPRHRAPCSSVNRRSAPRAAAIAFEPAGEQTLKGKQAPVPAWRAMRVVGERGGRNRSGGARGAVRRPPGRAPPAQGAVPRDRPRAAAASRQRRRARGHRQVQARRGSSSSTSTAWSRSCTGIAAARPRTARASRSGRWARWSASAPAWPSRTTSRPRATKVHEMVEQWVTDPRRADVDRARAAHAAGRRGGHGGRPAVRRLAHVLRAHRRAGHGRAGLRGHALRRRGPARLHRPPARMEPRPADLRRHAGATGPDRAPARRGARASATSCRSTSSRWPRRTCASCSQGSCPACRRVPCPRSWRAPTASRCTRSRPCARSSPTAGWSRRAASTCRAATSRPCPCRTRSRR